jgi:hypothetical protein
MLLLCRRWPVVVEDVHGGGQVAKDTTDAAALILVAFQGVMFGMLPWLGVRLGLGPRPRLPGYVEALA